MNKKGKKIILSEAQFKEYVRRQLNENMGNESGVSAKCNDLADSLKNISDYLREMGNIYARFYDVAKEYLEGKGFIIGDMKECQEYGEYGVAMTADGSRIPLHEDYEENQREMFLDDLADETINEFFDSVREFSVYFDGIDTRYKNGIITLFPQQRRWISFDRIDDFLSNE